MNLNIQSINTGERKRLKYCILIHAAYILFNRQYIAYNKF